VTTLREATAASVNPRISPVLSVELNQRSLKLLNDANQISERLDALQPDSSAHLAIHRDLDVLGGQVQGYTQAVVNALEGVGEGLQIASSLPLHLGTLAAAPAPLTPEEEKAKNTRKWIIIGVVAATALAGIGALIVAKQSKKNKSRTFGRIKGAMSAR